MYYTANYIVGLTYIYLALYFHGLYPPDKKDSDLSYLWPYVQAVTLVNFLTTLCFLLVVKRPYLATFTGNQTSKQAAATFFFSAPSDEAKFGVFEMHPDLYASFKTSVMKWVRENWDKWVDERPPWFDEVR